MTMLTLCNGNDGNNGIFPTKKMTNQHHQHSQNNVSSQKVSTKNTVSTVSTVVPLQTFKRHLSQWWKAILKLKLANMSGKGQGDGSDGSDSISSNKKMKTRHDKHPQNNGDCHLVSNKNAVFAVMPSPHSEEGDVSKDGQH